jgi:anti-sigma B factor antagonist
MDFALLDVDLQDESSVEGQRAKRIASSYEKETRMRPVRPPPDPDSGLAYRELTARPLQLSNLRSGDSVVIALCGDLDLASADELDAVIRDAEVTDIGWIVVDLSDVSFIDSTGLSVLLHAKKRSNDRLSCIPSNHDAVTRLLELTGTIQMLDSD